MDYYISPDGIDSNQGTITAPFKTLDKGLNQASAGDRVIMRGGTYRNRAGWFQGKATASNPVRVEAHPGETVNLSAFGELVGWEPFDLTGGKAIYRAPMPFTMCNESLPAGEDLLIWNGSVLNEAQWPPANINSYPQSIEGWAAVEDGQWISDPTVEKADVFAKIYDSDLLDFPDNSLVGTYITILLGARWTLLSGKITANQGNSLTFVAKSPGGSSFYKPDGRSLYFLFGSQQFLSYPGSWWRDAASKTVYAWLPDSSDPAKATVEARQTDRLIDYWSRSYYQNYNLNFIGAGVNIANAAGTVFEGCTFQWYSHRLYCPTSWAWINPALYHNRDGLTLRDCDFVDAVGSVVAPEGAALVIENCTAINTDGINFGGVNSRLVQNTVWKCPYGVIKLSNDLSNSKVKNNDIGHGGLFFTDGGLLLVARTARGTSVEVYNNLLQGGQGLSDGSKEFYGTAGLYFEDNTAQIKFHHNIIAKVTSPSLNICGDLENVLFVNNVFDDSLGIAWWMNKRYHGCKFINNYATKFNSGTNVHPDIECRQNAFKQISLPNNLLAPDPKFNPDYSLQSDSVLKGAGTVVNSITSTTPPDIGAWEGNRELVGAVLRKKDLLQLQIAVAVVESSLKVELSNLPLGRKPGAEFSLRVGERMALRSGEKEFVVEDFTAAGSSQQIWARINSSGDWLQIGTANIAAPGENGGSVDITEPPPAVNYPAPPPPPPNIVSISPARPIAGETITLNGSNFTPGAAVKFGELPGLDISVKSATWISAKIPQVSGSVLVWVQNSDGSNSNIVSLTIDEIPVPAPAPPPVSIPAPVPTPTSSPAPTEPAQPVESNLLCRAIGDRVECWDLNKGTWVLWVDRSVKSSENSQDVLVEIIRSLSVSLLAQANTISRLQSKIEALETTKSNLELTITILRGHQTNIDSSHRRNERMDD
jgi:hypothetical protein